jgi:hypothetical protein
MYLLLSSCTMHNRVRRVRNLYTAAHAPATLQVLGALPSASLGHKCPINTPEHDSAGACNFTYMSYASCASTLGPTSADMSYASCASRFMTSLLNFTRKTVLHLGPPAAVMLDSAPDSSMVCAVTVAGCHNRAVGAAGCSMGRRSYSVSNASGIGEHKTK